MKLQATTPVTEMDAARNESVYFMHEAIPACESYRGRLQRIKSNGKEL